MTAVMTTKDLHIATKRDDGMAYLMERFGFSEQSELFDAIRKVSPSKAESFIKTLEKKQKQFNKRARNSNVTSETTTEAEIQVSEVIVESSEESVDEEFEQEDNSVPTVEENSTEIPSLEQLLEEENELSSIICGIEGEHKNLVTRRRALVSRLENCQRALGELQRLLRAQEENVTRTYQEFLECASQMEELNAKKKTYTKQLDIIRQKIDDMKKVNIFVYENASFEVENLPIEPIADSEVSAQSIKLFALPEAEELTAKEIKTIAKLLVVVELIEANGYKTELVFDCARVQMFWETVIAQN